ncbi:ABC transporter permease [Streptomyces alfalfae]|uniref:ABC transporter permease n=1 Tax=Streptomyces alfalfae TaxID=1642299 RepID=UPI002811E968|nr:ABC transporter permease [Streptomyces alfalfae]
MSTLTADPARTAPAGARPPRSRRMPRLGGPVWLVWRQHRAALWTLLTLTLLTALAMVHLRGELTNHLAASVRGGPDLEQHVGRLFSVGSYLGYAPVLAGVLIGAPLVAGDLETGTAKLVTSQSVSRLRWLTTKLVMPAALIALSTTLLGAVFTWWWNPVRSQADTLEWTSSALFDVTGPMPAAYALLTFTVGAAVGMLLRRTLVSMVVTLGIVVAIGVVWDRFRLDLGNVLSVTTDTGVGPDARQPELPAQAVQQGQGTDFLTDSGARLDWTTCLDTMENTRAHTACLKSKHVIGYAADYLPASEMQPMQWLGAAIMLTATAAVTTFIIIWGRKRLL